MKSRATMLIVCIFMLMISGFPMQSAVTAPSEDTSQSSSGGEPEQTTETPAPVAQPDQVFSTASESWTKDYVDSHSVTTGSVTNFNYLQNSDGVSSHWEEAPIDEDILSAHEEFVGVWDGWYEYPDNDVWSPITASGGYLTNTDFQTITFLYSPVYDLAGYETFDWSLQYTNWAGSGAFYVQWKGDDGYWRTVATLRSDALGYVIETEEILDASAHNPEDEIYFHSGFQVRLQLNPASLDMVEVHDHALTAVRYKHEFYAEFYFTGADYSQAQEYLVIDFDHPQGDEGIFIEVLNPSAEWITIDTIGAPVPIDGLRSYDISSYLTSASLSIRISDSSSRHIGYTGDIDDSYWNIDAIYLNIYTVLPDDMTPSSIVSGGYGTVTDFAYMQDSPPLDGYDAILAEVSVPVVQWTTHSSVTSFGTFPPSGYSEYSINFEQAWEGTVQYAHVTGIELSSYDGGLQSGTYSTASAQEVEVRFDTQYAGVDTGEWLVQVLATSGWVTIFQETGTNNIMETKTWSSTQSIYLHSNFAVRFEARTITEGEYIRLDNILIRSQVTVDNYRFEKTFQFDNIEGDLFLIELLHIDMGASPSETLTVEGRTGTSGTWTSLGTISSAGDNTFQVTDPILTGSPATFQVRVTDGTTSSDGTSSSWAIDGMYLTFNNYRPRSIQAPTSDGLRDTDTEPALYAYDGDHSGYVYLWTLVEDLDDPIDRVFLTAEDGEGTLLWRVLYDGGTWEEHNGLFQTDYDGISITYGSASNPTANRLLLRWTLRFTYKHPNVDNLVLTITSLTWSTEYNTYIGSSDTYETGWNVETRVELIGALGSNWGLLSDGERCSAGGSVTFSGDVRYYGSASNRVPSTVSYYIARDDMSGSWPLSYENAWNVYPSGDGTFSIGLPAKDSVSMNTYSFHAIGGQWPLDSVDCFVDPENWPEIQSDQIVITSSGVIDNDGGSDHVVGTGLSSDNEVLLYYTLEYESDSTLIWSGTSTWSVSGSNGITLTYNSDNSRWEGPHYETTAVTRDYDTLEITTSEGVSTVNTHPTASVTWDTIIINSIEVFNGTGIEDYHVNTGENVEVRVYASLAINGDSHWDVDDTLELTDGTSTWALVWDSSGYFKTTTSVQHLAGDYGKWTFSVTTSNGYEDDFGISSVDPNAVEVSVIWDEIEILSFELEISGTPRLNWGTLIEARITARLAYTGDGIITLDDANDFIQLIDDINSALFVATWDPTNSWLDVSLLKSESLLFTFSIDVAYEDTYEISAIKSNSLQVQVIWDRTEFYWYEVSETHTPYTESIEFRLRARLDYDNHPLGDGDTIVILGQTMQWDSENNWFDTDFTPLPGLWSYFMTDSHPTNHSLEADFSISAVWDNAPHVAVISQDIVSMDRFQYGFRDTMFIEPPWVDGTNASSGGLASKILSMDNNLVGSLEASWCAIDISSATVMVGRYPIFYFRYSFNNDGSPYIQAALVVIYNDGTTKTLRVLLQTGTAKTMNVDLNEYGLASNANVTGLRVELYETTAGANGVSARVTLTEMALDDNRVPWSHDYQLDVHLVSELGASVEGVTVRFYWLNDSQWILLGSSLCDGRGWAKYELDTRTQYPGTTMQFLVTWNSTEDNEYLYGYIDTVDDEHVIITVAPLKVYAADVSISALTSPVEYGQLIMASIGVVDQDGNQVNSSLGFAYRLVISELGYASNYGYWTSANWHSMGRAFYTAGASLSIIASFQASDYYELVGTSLLELPVIKSEITSSSLSSHIVYYVHTQLGDTVAGTTIEYSDAMKVTITIYDDYLNELVTQVVNVTISYNGVTYWGLTSGGTVSIILPEAQAVGSDLTLTLTGLIAQNYTLNDDTPQSKTLSVIRETISYLSAESFAQVGLNSLVPFNITAYDNDNEALDSVQLIINGTDIFNTPSSGLVDFSLTHHLALEGNLSLVATNGSSNYNTFTTAVTHFVSTGLRLLIEDIQNEIPIYKPVIVNVTMEYTWDNSSVETGFFSINGTVYAISNDYCVAEYFDALQAGIYNGILVPLNDSLTVLVPEVQFLHIFNWTSCNAELHVLIQDSYALDIVQAVYYLYNVDDSTLISVAGFEILAYVYHQGGVLTNGLIYTNSSGYAVLSFNLSLVEGTAFHVNGTYNPEPPLNPDDVTATATTLARPLSSPIVTITTPKGISTDGDFDWFFSDDAILSVIIRDYSGTTLTVPINCELRSGTTTIWSDTQSGVFGFTLCNIWGDNASSLDTFRFYFTIDSDYFDRDWEFIIDADLVMEVSFIIPEHHDYVLHLGNDLNISGYICDSDGVSVESNTTDILGAISDIYVGLYILNGSWTLVENMMLSSGTFIYEWDWEELDLDTGVYDLELRIGGPSTGYLLSTASITVTVGKIETQLTELTQQLTVFYGGSTEDCVSVKLSAISALGQETVELWVIVGSQHFLLSASVTDVIGMAKFDYDPDVLTLIAGSYKIYAVFGGSDEYAGSVSDEIWMVVAKNTPTLALLTDLSSTNYSQHVQMTCYLESSFGDALAGREMTIAYYNGTSWIVADTCATNATGYGSLSVNTRLLALGPSQIRLCVTGDSNYASVSSYEGITVNPSQVHAMGTTMTLNGHATEYSESMTLLDEDEISITTQIVDLYGNPIDSTQFTVTIGGTNYEFSTDALGYLTFELVFNTDSTITYEMHVTSKNTGFYGIPMAMEMTVYAGYSIYIDSPDVVTDSHTAICTVRVLNDNGESVSARVILFGETFTSSGSQTRVEFQPATGSKYYPFMIEIGSITITRTLLLECVSIDLEYDSKTDMYPNERAFTKIYGVLTPFNTTIDTLRVSIVTLCDGNEVSRVNGTLSSALELLGNAVWDAPLANGTYAIATLIEVNGFVIYQETRNVYVYSVHSLVSGDHNIDRGQSYTWTVQVFRDNVTLGGVFNERVLIDGLENYEGAFKMHHSVNWQFFEDGEHNITVILTVYGITYEDVFTIYVTSSDDIDMMTLVLGGVGFVVIVVIVSILVRRSKGGPSLPSI